jgi:hypothetical protein
LHKDPADLFNDFKEEFSQPLPVVVVRGQEDPVQVQLVDEERLADAVNNLGGHCYDF